jgi:hypothetical protein
MLSVRNMLIDPEQESVTTAAREEIKKSSVLHISSLLCSSTSNNDTRNLPPIQDQQQVKPPIQNSTLQYSVYDTNDNAQQAQSTHQQPRYYHSSQSYYNQQNEDYVTDFWSRHKHLHRPRVHPQEHERSAFTNRLSPLISSYHHHHPYDLLDKDHTRSSRQHLIESRKIEHELLHDRRRTSSCSSVYSYSSSTGGDKSNNEDFSCDDDIPSTIKAKRRRASSRQLDVLNKVFKRTIFPSTQLRAELGRQLDMSPRTVQIWFQNKRQAARSKEQGPGNSSSSSEDSISTLQDYY